MLLHQDSHGGGSLVAVHVTISHRCRRRGDGVVPPETNSQPWPDRLPVMILSARTAQADMLPAFEAGADDFLLRSAGYLELRARLRALLRRATGQQEREPLNIGPLIIDPAAHAASLHGKRLELRRLEYELLLYLARKPNRVFRKHELLKDVWGCNSS
jgi:DNA-binding response OmpR family regulator